MLINRGDQNNGIFMWDESVDKFTLGLTTADGTSTGNITLSSLGTLVANLEGNVTGTIQTAAQPNITSLGTLTGLTTTGDINFGDDDKAVFGTDSDLEVYFDGFTAWFDNTDSVTKDTQIKVADGGYITLKAGTDSMIQAAGNSSVSLYYDNSPKLATTATGIDVTGTVTMDGLTVDGTDTEATTSQLLKVRNSTTGEAVTIGMYAKADNGGDGNTGSITFDAGANGTAANNSLRFSADHQTDLNPALKIDGNRDISFYDYTGVSQALFWDASTERLGIGTTSPTSPLTIKSSSFSASNSGMLIQANGNTNTIISMGEKSTDGGRFHMYDGGVEKIAFYTDGTANHISAGNVGIGASSPTDKLDIAGALRLTANISFDSNKSGRIYKASNHGLAFHGVTGTENDFAMFNPAGQLMVTNPTGTNNVSLIPTAAGNVGIGTTSPSYKLGFGDSVGTERFSIDVGTIEAEAIHVATANRHLTFDASGPGSRYISFKTGSTAYSGTEKVRIDSSGRVGIGTSSPDTLLNLAGDETAVIRLENSNGSASDGDVIGALQFYKADSSGAGAGVVGQMKMLTQGVGSGGHLTLSTGDTNGNDTERLRISSNGNVGIGTTSPNAKLSIHAAVNNPAIEIVPTTDENSADSAVLRLWGTKFGTANRYSEIRNVTDGSTANNELAFNTNGSERMRIDSSGNLLVGTTSADPAATSQNTVGTAIGASGYLSMTRDSAIPAFFNRKTSDGSIVQFRKDASTVGSIGTVNGDLLVGTGDTGLRFHDTDNRIYPINTSGGTKVDATIDLGDPTGRFKDLYLSGGLRGDTTFKNNAGTTEYARFDSSGRLGIGTTTVDVKLHIGDTSASTLLKLERLSVGGTMGIDFNAGNNGSIYNNIQYGRIDVQSTATGGGAESGVMTFHTRNSGTTAERMRIDSSGNLLVGKTSADISTEGNVLFEAGGSWFTNSSSSTADFNRLSTDGEIVRFNKDGTTVGSIGTGGGDLIVGNGSVGIRFNDSISTLVPRTTSDTSSDGAIDIGASSARFQDIYATNGTIQTSDINEKQDIEDLSEAETRVAVVAKGLLKKYRWKSAVADKGDDARIHFGIMAQDLQQAFSAEGLDAGDYGMFISSTWTDETTGEEKTRLGVRYNELLAFIIAGI
jgi:hypothetical protein